MSVLDWYHHKAEQCARRAKKAANPHMRDYFKEEESLWLEIADRFEPDDENPFGSKLN
jgi:hypothetical protein